MIKETVSYEDLNGDQQTEDLYFHLSKSEMIDLEMGVEGGLGEYLQKMVQSHQPAQILAAFKKIIEASYGEKSEDGRRFIKDPEKTKEFMSSPAFDAVLWKLATSEEEVTAFVLGLVPKDLVEMAGGPDALLSGKAIESVVPGPALSEPADAKPWADREPTSGELMNMSRDDLLEVYRRKLSGTAFAPPEPEPPAPPAA